MRDRFTFLIFLACVGLASFFGAQFVPGAWYEALQKPPLNPPNWIFAPVWSALYLAVAVAGWLVWRSGPTSRLPLALWGSQLALNAAWSWLFFGLERPGLALINILILLAVLLATLISFHRIHPWAGRLFVPYAAWVMFATYLNAGLWYLNP